jgi:hypothetical protein
MTTIYCIKSENNSEMFMSLQGMAKWLTEQKPINNKFYTLSGICGETRNYFDITADNLAKVMEESKQQTGLCADIRIEQDFFIQTIETRYVLSTANVND